MRFPCVTAVLLAAAVAPAALAQGAPATALPGAAMVPSAAAIRPRTGMTLRDAKQQRVGIIDRTNADGTIQLIYDGRYITIPGNTLTVSESGAVTTSLSKREIDKLP